MTVKSTTGWALDGFGLDRLSRTTLIPPPLGDEDILVEVAAAALNYRDLLVVDGTLVPDLAFPFVPGSDAVGRVIARGAGATGFAVGDRVLTHLFVDWRERKPPARDLSTTRSRGGPLQGVLARHIVLDQNHVVRAPERLSDPAAATLPVAGLTAYSALVDDGRLGEGATVVVQGTGGVACFAIQFAAALGARVIATSSSDSKLERARTLGATETINYRETPAWDEAVLDLTDGRGADRIVELAAGDGLQRSIHALAFGGEIAQIGFLGDPVAAIHVGTLMLRQASIRGIAVGSRAAFERMVEWLDRTGIEPVIDSIHRFADADEAFRRMRSGPFGKVIIQP